MFDELFRLEVALALSKQKMIDQAVGIAHESRTELLDRFVENLPYRLTGAQERVIGEIRQDMLAPHPMHRLLLGEVGSGKTVVAVASLLAGIEGGYQGAVMAPTEVLAEQHYLGIKDLLEQASLAPLVEGEGADLGMPSLFEEHGPDRPVTIALLTGSNSEVSFRPPGSVRRDDIVGWIADGRIDLVIGTHALIQEGVHFARLGVAVVDEQHRFGVHQRVELKDKAGDVDPDLLIMTATPIPRTLSMTLYGDLDVSELDEMPPGRPEVTTIFVGKDPAELGPSLRTGPRAGGHRPADVRRMPARGRQPQDRGGLGDGRIRAPAGGLSRASTRLAARSDAPGRQTGGDGVVPRSVVLMFLSQPPSSRWGSTCPIRR